jgi:hypothetical protein
MLPKKAIAKLASEAHDRTFAAGASVTAEEAEGGALSA